MAAASLCMLNLQSNKDIFFQRNFSAQYLCCSAFEPFHLHLKEPTSEESLHEYDTQSCFFLKEMNMICAIHKEDKQKGINQQHIQCSLNTYFLHFFSHFYNINLYLKLYFYTNFVLKF